MLGSIFGTLNDGYECGSDLSDWFTQYLLSDDEGDADAGAGCRLVHFPWSTSSRKDFDYKHGLFPLMTSNDVVS